MSYPIVMSEWNTMEHAVIGWSLARFGDGELRLALGEGKCISQEHDPKLAAELREILSSRYYPEISMLLVGIPNSEAKNGKPVMWGPTRYSAPRYTALYERAGYASSFVTRPDSAPWIDNEQYWLLCRRLWWGKDVTLVIGTRGGSLTTLHHAKSVRLIYGPERDAYRDIDGLEREIGEPDHSVLICLGPCATVLAARLARKGVHALDLGHIGRFMPQKYLQPEPVELWR
jgi:hypothetical protein